MNSEHQSVTPVGAVVRGLVAGAIGTLAMDLLLFARYKRGGGKSSFRRWELSADLDGWDQAPAPAHVGKRLVEGLFQRELPKEQAPLVNNVTHWAYGMGAGLPYGVVAGSARRPHFWYGIPFGTGVWATGYVVLPAAKLYRPIWEYDARTLANDLSAHLVYGMCTAIAFKALSARPGRRRQ